MSQQTAAVGIPILSAVAATKSRQLAGIHLALGVNVVVTLASVVLAGFGCVRLASTGWLRASSQRRGGNRHRVERAVRTCRLRRREKAGRARRPVSTLRVPAAACRLIRAGVLFWARAGDLPGRTR